MQVIMPLQRLTQHVSYAPLIFLFFIGIGLLAHLWIPTEITMHTLRIASIGALFLAIAPVVLLWAFDNRINTHCEHEECEHKLGDGPYNFSRHPNYIAFVLLMVGLAFVMNSWVMIGATLAAVLFFTLVIIPPQERFLGMHYGESYTAYRREVRMWI